MEIFLDALLDALIDGVKMLPFLYLAYLLIEWLERHHGENIENALAGGGRWGFLPGALLGCVPQCGFSAVASNFYASRVITPGWPYLSPPATRPFRCWPLSRASGPPWSC